MAIDQHSGERHACRGYVFGAKEWRRPIFPGPPLRRIRHSRLEIAKPLTESDDFFGQFGFLSPH